MTTPDQQWEAKVRADFEKELFNLHTLVKKDPLGRYTLEKIEAQWEGYLHRAKQDKAAREDSGRMQAAMDRLMLEFCPDEMTTVQRKAWADAQALLESKT